MIAFKALALWLPPVLLLGFTGLLAACNTQGGGSGGNAIYQLEFDNTANRQAFHSMPDAVPIRARLTLKGTSGLPQVRLQYRYISEDGTSGPWQDGPNLQLTQDQGGYLAQATLGNIWPVGLDLAEIRQKARLELRALVGNQVLATSTPYLLERINPLWVRVFPEPSVFWSMDIGGGKVCAAGGTTGQDMDPLTWCLDGNGQVVYEIRETGPAWGYLNLAIASEGTIYLLPNGGPIKAYRDGAFTNFNLTPRGYATTLAVDEQALYVGGALDKTNRGCSVKRLYVDRYNLSALQREASLEFDATQAQEDPDLTSCETNNSAPALLKVVGERLFMVHGVRISGHFDDRDRVFYTLNRLGMAALDKRTLNIQWLYARSDDWRVRGSCVKGAGHVKIYV